MKKKKTIINKKYKINKRGESGSFLAEHVLGIIVAVLCIVFLIVLAVIVYNWFSEKTDYDKAESNIKLVYDEIDLIYKSTGNNVGNIIIYPPIKWVLRSYTNSFPQTECYGKTSCLCICEAVTCEGVQKICYGFDYKVEVISTLVSSSGRSWYDPRRYFVNPDEYPNAMGFSQPAEGLKIYKQEDKIIVEQIKSK
jgi:hypothetical protein